MREPIYILKYDTFPYSVATLVAVLTFYFSTVAVSVIPRQIIEHAVFIVRMSIPTRMRVFLRAG